MAAAGVARGTFYQYFDSKHAIFVELLDRLLDELRSSVSGVDPTAGADSFEAQLQAIIQSILETTLTNRPLTRGHLEWRAEGEDSWSERPLENVDGTTWRTEVELLEPVDYTVVFTDGAGAEVARSPRYRLEAIPDRARRRSGRGPAPRRSRSRRPRRPRSAPSCPRRDRGPPGAGAG